MHNNQAFGNHLIELFIEWLANKVDKLGANAKAPMPDRHEMAKWIRDTWEKVDDNAMRGAILAAYFPHGRIATA